jgi:hypothetical protein
MLISTHLPASCCLLLASPSTPVHVCTYTAWCCCCLVAAWGWHLDAVKPAVRQLHIICIIKTPRCDCCNRLHREALSLPLLLLWQLLLLLLLLYVLIMLLLLLLLHCLPLSHRWLCWNRIQGGPCLLLPALLRLPQCLVKQTIQCSKAVVTELCVKVALQGTQAPLC